ncbi:MAG TPA: TIR domain-containing protein [Xanthobacteraceae bacterium]|jgi:predicted nucleotide-binding protein|nr:TIR domain-containing protein [Xanthobacteraceae bacterium]
MKKTKSYANIKFSSRIVRRGIDICTGLSNERKEGRLRSTATFSGEKWELDNVEDFLSHYASDEVEEATLDASWDAGSKSFSLYLNSRGTQIGVQTNLRASIESVFSIFEDAPAEDKAALSAKRIKDVSVFIGHGQDRQWEKLKAHLQDQLGLEVTAYETGARAGHTIRDVLEKIVRKSSMALLVLTKEGSTGSALRARENVIHECGLFQGRLGFDRAVLLVEDGVELASSFDDIPQLRFRKGRLSEVFDDVLVTLRREFGSI